MSRRNMKPDYINRIRKTPVPNGYKFDLANYLYNLSYDYDYPSFVKMIGQTPETETYRRVYYFKYHGGTGEYLEETYTRKKNGDNWQVVRKEQEKVLESANRFNLKKLLSFC